MDRSVMLRVGPLTLLLFALLVITVSGCATKVEPPSMSSPPSSVPLATEHWLDARESYPIGWNGFIPFRDDHPRPASALTQAIEDDDIFERSGIEYRVASNDAWTFLSFIDNYQPGVMIKPALAGETVTIESREVINGIVAATFPPIVVRMIGGFDHELQLFGTDRLCEVLPDWCNAHQSDTLTFGDLHLDLFEGETSHLSSYVWNIREPESALVGHSLVARLEVFDGSDLIYEGYFLDVLGSAPGFGPFGITYAAMERSLAPEGTAIGCVLTTRLTGEPAMAAAWRESSPAWDGQVELTLEASGCERPATHDRSWRVVHGRIIR